MANIGTFTADKDGFTGTLRTLTLNVKVKLVPNDKGDTENAPDFRLQAAGHDIGAAWKKTSEAGREYLSVTLDDPSFPATVYVPPDRRRGRHARPDLVAQQAPGGLTAAAPHPLRWGAVPHSRHFKESTPSPGLRRIESLPYALGLRLQERPGVSVRRTAGLCGLRPVPTSPSRPSGSNPSRLRACSTARFACPLGESPERYPRRA